jgi:putative transposase
MKTIIHKTIRLPGWDYTRPGIYYLTIVAMDRVCLFGNISNGIMYVNDFGAIVRDEWLKTATIRSTVTLDEFVVMPDHFHGIIILQKPPRRNTEGTSSGILDIPTQRVGPTITSAMSDDYPKTRWATYQEKSFQRDASAKKNLPKGPISGSIGAIIGQFKSIVSKQINTLRNTPGCSVWQGDYYDHIGRNQKDLDRIRKYIRNNPARWKSKDKHPGYIRLPNPQQPYMGIR